MNNRIRSGYSVAFAVAVLLALGSHNLFAKKNQPVYAGSCVSGAYPTIQSAVNAVDAGGTVLVCPGTYPEQVSISQALTLRGFPSGNNDAAVITVPAGGLIANGTLLSGAPVAAQILVSGISGVYIRDLAVDGSNNGFTDCAVPQLMGIVYQNSTGTVTRVVARNQALTAPADGCQNGLGIYIESGNGGSSNVRVENSSVHGYQKNGVTADAAGTTVELVDNTIVGQGPVPGAAENGIQVGFGATGVVRHNRIADNVWTSPNSAGAYAAIGILVYASTGVDVLDNRVGSSQIGIGVYSDPTYGSGDHSVIHRNTVFGTQLYDGMEACSNNNSIRDNVLTNNASSGIHLDDTCGSTGNGNIVTGNSVSDSCAAVLEGPGTSGNFLSHNSIFDVSNIVLNADTCSSGGSGDSAVRGAGGTQASGSQPVARPSPSPARP